MKPSGVVSSVVGLVSVGVLSSVSGLVVSSCAGDVSATGEVSSSVGIVSAGVVTSVVCEVADRTRVLQLGIFYKSRPNIL